LKSDSAFCLWRLFCLLESDMLLGAGVGISRLFWGLDVGVVEVDRFELTE